MRELQSEKAATAARLHTLTVTYRSVQREVSVLVPSSYVPGQAMPLVFALHGGSGDASVMYAPGKRIASHAESDGFIAAFPNGLPKPELPNSHNYFWADPVNEGYMAFLMNELIARYTVDDSRIYFIGFSGGAQLIYRIASDPRISARIAAVGTVAGDIGSRAVTAPAEPWEIIDPGVTGGIPMPAYLVHGGRDPNLPIHGGFDGAGERIGVGFETKVAIWRQFTGALAESTYATRLPPDVTARTWLNNQNGHVVVAVTDETLPHSWPSWDLMAELWRFFQSMPAR